MQTARYRYDHDVQYRQCADFMVNLIHEHHFTPSEMREMAVHASIKYEMVTMRDHIIPITPEIEHALEQMREWRGGRDGRKNSEEIPQEFPQVFPGDNG